MATAASTLVARTRRFVRDYPETDQITASTASSSTSLTVADATVYAANWVIQVGTEAMRVVSGASTTLTVRRAVNGTTAATHPNGDLILVKPKFLDVEMLDALNEGLDSTFPFIYQPVLDTSLSVSNSTTYEFTVPFMADNNAYPIPYLSKIEWKDPGGLNYYEVRRWRVRRGSTPKIVFPSPPTSGTSIRLSGYGPFSRLTGSSDSLDVLFPPNAEGILVWFAGNYLLASGEAGRVAIDTGAAPVDARENANRPGSSMTAANALFQRFQLRLRDASMPPLPRHAVPTF